MNIKGDVDMRSKKFITLGLMLIGVSTISLTGLYARETSKQSIQTNVIYSAKNEDPKVSSQSNATQSTEEGVFSNTTSESATYYRNQTDSALKKYFNISIKDKNRQDVTLIDDQFLTDYYNDSLQELRTEYNNKEITEEEFNDCLEMTQFSVDGFRKQMEQLNHDFVIVDYVDDQYSHTTYFNANTKEVIMLRITDTFGLDTHLEDADTTNKKPEISVDATSFEALGVDFINEYQLGDLQIPKLLKTKVCNEGISNAYLLYQDASDASKKVVIVVNPNKPKVCGFYIKSYANLMADTFFN